MGNKWSLKTYIKREKGWGGARGEFSPSFPAFFFARRLSEFEGLGADFYSL